MPRHVEFTLQSKDPSPKSVKLLLRASCASHPPRGRDPAVFSWLFCRTKLHVRRAGAKEPPGNEFLAFSLEPQGRFCCCSGGLCCFCFLIACLPCPPTGPRAFAGFWSCVRLPPSVVFAAKEFTFALFPNHACGAHLGDFLFSMVRLLHCVTSIFPT